MIRSTGGIAKGMHRYLLAITCSLILGSGAHGATLVIQDLDDDGDVDSTDFALLRGCLSGTDVPHDGSDVCTAADIDDDGDVDMADFGAMQECFSGPGVPGSPTCGGWCIRPKADLPVGVTMNPVIEGGSTSIYVSNSQLGVNYQLRNHATNANIGNPVAGTGGAVYLPTDAITTQTTYNVLAINAAAACSVQLAQTQTVDTYPYSPKNKIGVHVVIGSRNGFTPFLRACRDAGKPVAVIKCVDDFGAAYEAKVMGDSPQSLTMGRINTIDGRDMGWLGDKVGQPPAEVAQWYYNLVKPKWQQHWWIDVWETLNEMSSDWTWQADFYIAMMDLAEAGGFRLANWGASVGNPPESAYWDVARTCARAKAHGNHMLTLHEYAIWAQSELLQDEIPGLVLRYRRLYEYLAQHNAVCPLVLSEVGQGGGYRFVGTNLFVQDFGWYDARMREDWYVIGCAAWTLGNWSNANFQDALPALANYIVSH